MKKVLMMLLALGGISLVAHTQVFGLDIPVSATVPEGSYGATISGVIHVTSDPSGASDNWTTIGKVDNMVFGELAEIVGTDGKKLGVFSPADNRYYAIDIGVSGGGKPSSFPGITVEWADSGTIGLGDRLGATYNLMTWESATKSSETRFARQLINAGTPAAVNTEASYVGHWVRIYVGIITDPTEYGYTDPAIAATHIFTYSTPAGSYSGTLTVRIG